MISMLSMPLPRNHWIYEARPDERDEVRGCRVDVPHPVLDASYRQHVEVAARYAVRGATFCGKEMDFDPDALVRNVIVALCGAR